jgi:hypothetical protein
MDHYNRHLEKALSGNDQTHVLREAFTYDIPFGKGRHWSLTGAADRVLGGWGIAGVLEYSSGMPMSVAPGVTPVPGGAGNRVFINSYTNWLASPSGTEFDPAKDKWWNPAAFGIDASGNKIANLLTAGFGNATKNNPKIRTPWTLNENFSLSKNVDFTEHVKLTLRVEAFNIFNRVRWGGPDSTASSAGFGNVTSQGNDPRRMQFALKITF